MLLKIVYFYPMRYYRFLFTFLIIAFAGFPVYAQKTVSLGKPVRLDIKEHRVPAGNPDEIKLNPRELPPVAGNQKTKITAASSSFWSLVTKTLTPGKTFKLKSKCKIFKWPKAVPAGFWKYNDNIAENISWFDVDQGLSSSYNSDILEDDEGRMWLGMNNSGICVYDGKNIFNLDQKNGLENNNVLDLFYTRNKSIWVAFRNSALMRFKHDSVYHYTVKEGLPEMSVSMLAEDQNGTIWIATLGQGLFSLKENGTLTQYNTASGFPGDSISHIVCDKNNKLWFDCGNKGLFFIENEKLNSLQAPCLNRLPIIVALVPDASGNLFLGTNDKGLYEITKDKILVYDTSSGLPENDVRSIAVDKHDQLWLAFFTKGICRFNRFFCDRFIPLSHLGNSWILRIKNDSKNNLWALVFGKGIARLNNLPFVNYSTYTGLQSDRIVSMAADNKNRLWFGSYESGCLISEQGKSILLSKKEGMPGDVLRSIYKDHEGKMWLGYWNEGVGYVAQQTFFRYTTKHGLSNSVVLSICEDKQNRLWLGTNAGGVSVFDGKSFLHLTPDAGFPSENCWKIIADSQNNIWMITGKKGLVYYDGSNYYQYTTAQGLSGDRILSIKEDRKKRIWVGIRGYGINIIDKNRIIPIGLDDGLPNDLIWGFTEDSKGRMWVTTEKGIACITEENGHFRITPYSSQDGISGLDFFSNSVFVDSTGKMYWGSGKGLVTYFPEYETASTGNFPVFLQELTVYDNDSVFVISPRREPGAGRWPLHFSYTENHIVFNFSAPLWGEEQRMQFRYKLDGADANWNAPTGKAEVAYRNLDPGSYIFHLIAIDRFGNQSKEYTYDFIIHPPWWQTWWAYLFYIASFLLLLYLFIRFRTQTLLNQKKQLEQTVRDRTHEIVLQKELVDEKNKDITDSINYAQRIQASLLVPIPVIRQSIPESFVFFQPRDIVSGDFYYFACVADKIMLAAVDCTGHGVPGAFMSIIASYLLNEIILQDGITDPSKILTRLHKDLIEALNRNSASRELNDGMDMGLVCYDKKQHTIQFSGAGRPLIRVRNQKAEEIKGDRWSIGGEKPMDLEYKSITVALEKGDCVYLFSDGYSDQFGGEKGKKFKHKNLVALLESASALSWEKQLHLIETTYNSWKGPLEQIDDVSVIGFRHT